MKIIYITQHFPPEIGAAPGRAFEMSSNLAELGHDLHILTSFPNHTTTSAMFKKEMAGKLTIYRSFQVKDKKKSSLNRLANYFSFAFTSFVTGLFVRKPDVVYATSPQLFQAFAGYLLSKVHRTKFVFEVRDLWVDFAEVLGQFNNKKLLTLARKLERFLYRNADQIVVVTEGYKERLMELGFPGEKITIIPNGVNPEDIIEPKAEKDIRKEYGIPDDAFLLIYTGNIGAAQSLSTIVEAAERLQSLDPSIYFLFIGEGVEKEKLVQQAKNHRLTNILFLKGVPKKELESVYANADMGIVSLKDEPLFTITIPSKIFDYMAMGVPVLVGVDGETRRIVEQSDAGFFFKPENSQSFIETVLNAKEKHREFPSMKDRMRESLMKDYNRKILAVKLSDAFKKFS